jgi:hypothetical protein
VLKHLSPIRRIGVGIPWFWQWQCSQVSARNGLAGRESKENMSQRAAHYFIEKGLTCSEACLRAAELTGMYGQE